MQLIDLKTIYDLDNSSGTARRWKFTRDFLKKHLVIRGKMTVLDIGCHNKFGQKMAENFRLSYYCTHGDLDYTEGWGVIDYVTNPKVIFCFEVLEHLMNPLLFLNQLRSRYCDKDTQIFVSYPQNPCFLPTKHHFHEFKDDEFFTLIYNAKFEIVTHKRIKHWSQWWFYFTGIRPTIRLVCLLTGLSRSNLYLLKIRQ